MRRYNYNSVLNTSNDNKTRENAGHQLLYLFIFTFWFHQKQFLGIYMIIDKVRCYDWICLVFFKIDVLNIYVSRISIDACKTRRSIHFCFSVLTFRFNIFLTSCTSLLHLFLNICVCKRICCRNFDINTVTIPTNLRYNFILKLCGN